MEECVGCQENVVVHIRAIEALFAAMVEWAILIGHANRSSRTRKSTPVDGTP